MARRGERRDDVVQPRIVREPLQQDNREAGGRAGFLDRFRTGVCASPSRGAAPRCPMPAAMAIPDDFRNVRRFTESAQSFTSVAPAVADESMSFTRGSHMQRIALACSFFGSIRVLGRVDSRSATRRRKSLRRPVSRGSRTLERGRGRGGAELSMGARPPGTATRADSSCSSSRVSYGFRNRNGVRGSWSLEIVTTPAP